MNGDPVSSREHIGETELLHLVLDDLPAEQTARALHHARQCNGCGRQLAHLRAITAALSRCDVAADAIDAVDCVPSIRVAIARDRDRRPRILTRRWIPMLTMTALAAGVAAAAVMALLPAKEDGPLDEMVPKSATPGAAEDAWTGIQVYRTGDGDSVEPLRDRMQADDALVFSYTNRGDKPFTHLMVLAVDVRGEVHWYYPAFVQAGTDPLAIPISAGVVKAELPDKVKHALLPGSLTIYGVFVREPIRVSQIEALIAARGVTAAGRQSGPLPITDAVQQVLAIEVSP